MEKRKRSFNYADARRFRILFVRDPLFREIVKIYMKATNVSKQESAETILTYKTLQVLTVLFLSKKVLKQYLPTRPCKCLQFSRKKSLRSSSVAFRKLLISQQVL